MRRVALAEINSTLGVTLSVEFVTTTLNVAMCDEQGCYSANSGMWDSRDFTALKHRLIQYLDYCTPDALPDLDPQAFVAAFF